MVRNLIRNQAPRKGLRVRVPCPPLISNMLQQPLIHPSLAATSVD